MVPYRYANNQNLINRFLNEVVRAKHNSSISQKTKHFKLSEKKFPEKDKRFFFRAILTYFISNSDIQEVFTKTNKIHSTSEFFWSKLNTK